MLPIASWQSQGSWLAAVLALPCCRWVARLALCEGKKVLGQSCQPVGCRLQVRGLTHERNPLMDHGLPLKQVAA